MCVSVCLRCPAGVLSSLLRSLLFPSSLPSWHTLLLPLSICESHPHPPVFEAPVGSLINATHSDREMDSSRRQINDQGIGGRPGAKRPRPSASALAPGTPPPSTSQPLHGPPPVHCLPGPLSSCGGRHPGELATCLGVGPLCSNTAAGGRSKSPSDASHAWLFWSTNNTVLLALLFTQPAKGAQSGCSGRKIQRTHE